MWWKECEEWECSFRKNPYLIPPVERKFRGEGGVQKETIAEGGGLLTEVFFPGGLSKIGELLTNNSFSVEQAISYFTVTGVSKQVLLFPLIIFYLRSAKCFSRHTREFSLTELSSAHEKSPVV